MNLIQLPRKRRDGARCGSYRGLTSLSEVEGMKFLGWEEGRIPFVCGRITYSETEPDLPEGDNCRNVVE